MGDFTLRNQIASFEKQMFIEHGQTVLFVFAHRRNKQQKYMDAFRNKFRELREQRMTNESGQIPLTMQLGFPTEKTFMSTSISYSPASPTQLKMHNLVHCFEIDQV